MKEEKKQEEVKEKKDKKKNKKENKEILELTEQLNHYNEKCLRLQAEFINFKNRTAEEQSKLLKYEGESFIKKLLVIVDNFESAIKLDDNDLSDEVSKFLSGFKMIYANLVSILNNIGVEEIDVVGKEFDPNFAEAVMSEEDKNKPSNVVVEVYTKGYTYKDKVIRPAMVKVNK